MSKPVINTQLSNVEYSIAHPIIHKKESRIRVAMQIYHILQDFLKTKSFKELDCLDIGCSSGIITAYLSQFFKNIVGVDVDQNAINLAKQNYTNKNLSFLNQSGTDVKFPSNHFDIVICHEVYSYTEEQDKLLSEIFRVLKPRGICFFTADNLLFPFESQYHIPFLLYLPNKLAQIILKLLGHKKYYLGHYKNYWDLKKLCKNFSIYDYTVKTIMNPYKYKFVKLYKFEKIIKRTPLFILKILIYFIPTYIWILQKPLINEDK
jgi:2-polyprenyl-3-methyl-5-hydroxy-6-metoxy-1,4-benzoquinol methylase